MYNLCLVTCTPNKRAKGARQAVVGLASAVFAGTAFGLGSIGFLVGSSFGYVGGAFHYLQNCRRKAYAALEQYPRLMQHHLVDNFPLVGFEAWNLNDRRQLVEFKTQVSTSWSLQSMLTASWQTASSAIEVSSALSFKPGV